MPREILIGKKCDVEGVIMLLNRRNKRAKFRFEPIPEAKNLFLIIKETEDYEDCGVVRLKGEKIYAVSEDVYHFVYEIFEEVLE